MLLVAVETSSPRGSLALLEGTELIGEASFPEGLVHGREIAVRMKSLLEAHRLAPDRLEALAVGLGPGSYTGIRVGVTAAKVLAMALRIPVIGMSSLRVMAAGVGRTLTRQGGLCLRVVPAIDGKQRQVYLGRYRVGPGASAAGSMEVVEEVGDFVLGIPAPGGRPAVSPAPGAGHLGGDGALRELRRVLEPGALVVGDAADLVMETAAVPGLRRGPGDLDWPRASVLGELAQEKAMAHTPRFDPEAIHGLVPIYLRPSEAEIKFGVKPKP